MLDFYFRSGLTLDEFKAIADEITTGNDENLVGLINVNTASKEVLLCLPGLEESDVSALLANRPTGETGLDNIAWVAEALPQTKAVAVGSYITAKSLQFSADIVSVSGNGRAFRRCRVVVDASNSPPRVIYRQNLTYRGWPLPLEIIERLRSGTPIEQVIQNAGKEFG